MEISYHKNFNKTFQKLSPKMQEKVEKTIVAFQNDPNFLALFSGLRSDLTFTRAVSPGYPL
ncbi:MAG: hypothetical protein C4527_25275 [Candidatus Omnitrophota bacterium]|jgi:mRNA-degrading endonuclease RelE of RelBE toxin-antitoxin system|nr:MAG: hypothetical protein C4527_25275 [Candidatus Omnitrophota bacterium]